MYVGKREVDRVGEGNHGSSLGFGLWRCNTDEIWSTLAWLEFGLQTSTWDPDSFLDGNLDPSTTFH